MIFHKSLVRELRSTAGIVFATLLAIVITSALIRQLGRAAAGKADEALLLPLISLSSLSALGLIACLTAVVSVLLVLSRMWRSSEMVIWQASGLSPLSLIRPVLRFVLPWAALTAVATLVITPWTRDQSDQLRAGFEARGDAQRLAPGQFGESSSGRKVFFVENPDPASGELGLVFLLQRGAEGQEMILLASGGRLESDAQGLTWARVRAGNRTDLQASESPSALAVGRMSFEEYALRLDLPSPSARLDPSVRSQSLARLMQEQSPSAQGELAFRIGLPLLTLLLSVLAVPLSFVNPRLGRSFHMASALLLTLLAFNLLTVTQAWIAQERVPFLWAWWPLHLGLLVITAVLFWWRYHPRRGLWARLSAVLAARA
ncbi:MAG: export transporter permease LptF [Pseudomonadota bacterium]